MLTILQKKESTPSSAEPDPEVVAHCLQIMQGCILASTGAYDKGYLIARGFHLSNLARPADSRHDGEGMDRVAAVIDFYLGGAALDGRADSLSMGNIAQARSARTLSSVQLNRMEERRTRRASELPAAPPPAGQHGVGRLEEDEA